MLCTLKYKKTLSIFDKSDVYAVLRQRQKRANFHLVHRTPEKTWLLRQKADVFLDMVILARVRGGGNRICRAWKSSSRRGIIWVG